MEEEPRPDPGCVRVNLAVKESLRPRPAMRTSVKRVKVMRIKNQLKAPSRQKPLVGGFGCDELVLYGIRDTGGATL